MKKGEAHLQQLTATLQQKSRISLVEASAMLGVSESTARRLFNRMEQSGQALRIHGGLTRLPDVTREYSYDLVENRVLEQKKRIAVQAVEELLRAHHVYLDSGSTVFQVSRALADAVKGGAQTELTVFTNSLKNLEALSPCMSVHLIGGRYRAHRRDFCGFLAESGLQQLHFDLCVLGADGIKPECGLTTTDFETARMNSLAIEHAQRALVVADASKFDVCALVCYAQTGQVHRILTDQAADARVVEQIRQLGVAVDCV